MKCQIQSCARTARAVCELKDRTCVITCAVHSIRLAEAGSRVDWFVATRDGKPLGLTVAEIEAVRADTRGYARRGDGVTRNHIEAKVQTDINRRVTLCGLVVRWQDAGASPRFKRRGDCAACRAELVPQVTK